VYSLELHNNSKVVGFTAGTKSGNNAGAVRGQHGHMLVFDEADMLVPADMEAAYSVITNHPEATVWMSSTPTGKRETFFKTCMSKQWREYHFPSTVNPLWNDRLENMFREQMTEIAYKHEIMAVFGEQEEGVFQNVFVQAARSNYEYGQYAFNPKWTYTVGVDWNDVKNGTTIAVLGLDPNRNKFVLVDRHIVSRENWNQLAACEKVTEVNRIWRPLSIYLDKGYGHGAFEVLKKFGYDSLRDPAKGHMHPDGRLPYVLKQYDFSSTIDTRDLFSGQIVKKDAKPFLVETTMRRFEKADIEIPTSDDSLEAQLLGYVIDRITPSGRPVYKPTSETTGDHLLDALMLSVVAFVLEATPIGKPKFDTGLLFSGNFGQKIDSIIHKGDLVIKPDIKHKTKEERESHRPNQRSLPENRSLLSTKELPAAHINRDTRVGLWAWPGFSRDEPRPRVRTIAEAENDARKRTGLSPVRYGKPKRKNI
jgi:hypothetical protein